MLKFLKGKSAAVATAVSTGFVSVASFASEPTTGSAQVLAEISALEVTVGEVAGGLFGLALTAFAGFYIYRMFSKPKIS